MGNSNSQSLSRFTPSLLNGNHPKENRSKKQVTKFANPENRVLPVTSGAVQRLRSTDNGSILQSGGTISGRKLNVQAGSAQKSEFLHLLQKKCHSIQTSEQNPPYQTLYGHRKSHSDPDIVRMMCEKDTDEEDDDDDDSDDRFDLEGSSSNPRSIIAVSPSKAKIKSRKKNRAPEPPHSNTLPRSYDRTPISYSSDIQRKVSFRKKGDNCDTPRRPLPPIPPEELPPPPPPPPPDYNTRELEGKSIIKNHSKNYEKNRRRVDKWKFSKLVNDNHGEVSHRQRSKSLDRTEEQRLRECHGGGPKISLEKKNSLRNISTCHETDIVYNGNKKAVLSANDLKDAIADAAKKRAERLERSRIQTPPTYPVKGEVFHRETKSAHHFNRDSLNPPVSEHIKQYYFADPVALKHSSNNFYSSPNLHTNVHNRKFDEKINSHNHRLTPTGHSGTDIKNGSPHEENRIDYTIPHKGHRREPSTSTPKQCKWDVMLNEPIRRFLPDGTPSSCSSSEEEMEIDLQLRPTLPRRPIELPRFSPTDVWKSINLDFFKSHQQRSDVSSDDGDEVLEDKIHRINRPVAPRRLINDRSADSGISPDAGSPMPHIDGFEILMTNNNNVSPQNLPATPPINEDVNRTWVPQQDLVDDSDSASEHVPVQNSTRVLRPDSQAKFAMPNFMFPSRSLPRTEQQSNILDNEVYASDKERTRNRGRRKKSYRNAEGQHFNSLRNLKKALGLRTKSPIAAETPALDPNWSLSRSLPNFIDNLNVDAVNRKVETTEYITLDAIKRSNSESRAFQQNNNNSSNNMPNNVLNQQHKASHMMWDNSMNPQTPDGHVIYLPEYSSSSRKNKVQRADDLHVNTDSELVVKKSNSRKKFSYQSTVRQEEKKKLEEQLAREVEARERQRQKEIEWMNKVEEEFRKQRDKEKINIRHQLRILNLQEKSSNSGERSDNFIHQQEVNSSTRYSSHANTRDNDRGMVEHENYTKPVVNGNHDSKEMGYNNYKPTGMKKWLKRQNKYGDSNGLCSVRPEPEGGRSSSDDCRQLDWKRDCTSSRPMPHPSTENKEVDKQATNTPSSAENSDRPKSSPSPELMTPDRSFSVAGKKVERKRSNKEKLHPDAANVTENGNFRNDTEVPAADENYRFIRESVEEYELHTKLCRTNSGRTFESHSYYALERRKGDPVNREIERTNSFDKRDEVRPKQNLFSTLNFETELKENVRKKTREFEKRSRKHQSRDFESDDSGSDVSEIRHQQRHGTRGQRKKKDNAESREPSFSRNHPHRSAARKLTQVNGYQQVNGRLPGFQKSSSNEHLLQQHRISGSVLG